MVGAKDAGEPFRLTELGGGALLGPGALWHHVERGHVVIMHGQRVDFLGRPRHDGLGPGGVVIAGAHGDELGRLAGARLQEGAGLAQQVGVVIGPHVAAAAPNLVAHGEPVQGPGLVPAVGPAFLHQGAVVVRRHVGDPVGHFAHAAAAQVAVDVGAGADQFGEVHEFMGAEGVVLLHPAPVGVHDDGAAVLGADAVAPMVFIGEAAARPAHHRHMQVLQRLHHVLAIAADVGDGAVRTHPDAAIDLRAQMLRELAIDRRGDDRAGMVGLNGHRCRGGGEGHRGAQGGARQQDGGGNGAGSGAKSTDHSWRHSLWYF
ncbi:hypothetical protein AZA_63851 [Nitrospirillum viridazoti Y2]|nr:hypothetical protein AZA_63851 [Nitrospirillum amazonense Y2]